jgi:CheY-like chemotaxis protein
MREIVGMFELQARDKGLRFIYEPAANLPEVVRADEKRLRQILINIIGNAVKFTARGTVRVRLNWRHEMATIEVEDSGPGIDPGELARVFEPFERGRSARAGATAGTGLGLTISRMLTDLMGGEMSVDSTPGQGSTFRVRLFLPQLHGSQALDALPSVRRIGYKGVRRRILVVDNERVDRELLVSVLEPLGFEVAQAASGEECLQRIGEIRPHLVFMDLAMGGIDGWETLRRLRAGSHRDVPVAIISANAFDKNLDNDVGIGPEDFMLKPIRVDDLLEWIGRRLGLEWVCAEAIPEAPPAALPSASEPMKLPPAAARRELDAVIDLGYPRGILARLAEIEHAHPECGEFVRIAREMTRAFRFDALRDMLRGEGTAEEADDVRQ